MKRIFGYFAVSLLLVVGFTSCFTPQTNIKTRRTVIGYIVANNNLSDYARNDLNEIMKAYNSNIVNNCRTLLFYVMPNSSPRLIEVVLNKNRVDTTLIKVYDFDNCLATDAMKMVLEDAITTAPADEYGLILWSHSLGWIPQDITYLRSGKTSSTENNANGYPESLDYFCKDKTGSNNKPITKWFGIDGDNRMNITDLASVLENFDFNFILFDACFGASIEALYDLRNSADYILGSPSEVLGNGYPYGKYLSLFYEDVINLKGICEAYVTFYRDEYTVDGKPYPSAAMSLIDLSQLDSLASIVRTIVSTKDENTTLLRDIFQPFENRTFHLFYDFDQVIYNLAPPNDYQSSYQTYNMFRSQLEKVVVFNDYTERIWSSYNDGWFPINNCCGITTYCPSNNLLIEDDATFQCDRAFYRTNWAKDIGLTDPVDLFGIFQ